MRGVAGSVVLVTVLAACGGGGSAGAPAATTAATTATAPTTTAAPTTTVTPLRPQPDPVAAARALMAAWRDGDAAAAAAIAVPTAVQALFSAGPPGRVEERGCSNAKFDPAHCVFRTTPGEVQIRVTAQGDGWVVDQARVTPA